MKLFHIGLHKSGTTSLQRNLFQTTPAPYFGVEGPRDWKQERGPWLRFLLDGLGPPPTKDQSFIFSEEGLLLRAGIRGVAGVVQRIASLENSHVLVTIREPAALLRSAFFQSLQLRGSALGYSQGRQAWPAPTTRFQDFEEWWELQVSNLDASLAGLLNYHDLHALLCTALPREAVTFLPLEWLQDQPRFYASRLRNLGFPDAAISRFLAAPPQNTSEKKQLRHLHPVLFRKLKQTRISKEHWLEWIARKPFLGAGVTRMMYSGNLDAAGAPPPRLLAEISARYEAAWNYALQVAGSDVLGLETRERHFY